MSIKDRAREFFNAVPNTGDLADVLDGLLDVGATPVDLCKLMAAFAAVERETAVVEFAAKLGNNCTHGNWRFVMNEVFREMFNKELDG